MSTHPLLQMRYIFFVNTTYKNSTDWHQSHQLTACGDYSVDTKKRYVEILCFKHFHKHIVFTGDGEKFRNKEIKNYIKVSVVVDIECGDTTE